MCILKQSTREAFSSTSTNQTSEHFVHISLSQSFLCAKRTATPLRGSHKAVCGISYGTAMYVVLSSKSILEQYNQTR
ncbi:hypothetical protein Plhal304r1_c026g0087171 [Plasmopara halstedii]